MTIDTDLSRQGIILTMDISAVSYMHGNIRLNISGRWTQVGVMKNLLNELSGKNCHDCLKRHDNFHHLIFSSELSMTSTG